MRTVLYCTYHADCKHEQNKPASVSPQPSVMALRWIPASNGRREDLTAVDAPTDTIGGASDINNVFTLKLHFYLDCEFWF